MSELLEAWAAVVRKSGPKCAVVQAADGASVTFEELDRRSREWLDKHVPDPAALAGRAVIFALPNGIAWLEMFLGLMHAGAVAVPVESAEPFASQTEFARTLRAGFLWEGGRLTPLESPRRYRTPGACFIKLTSGSTGQPRALVFTACQLIADARQVTRAMGITAADSNLALIPFGHSYGMGNLTLPLVAMGVPIVCGTGALPRAILADCATWRPTVFPGVPVLWRALAEMDGADATGRVTLPGVRLCISAGAPLSVDVALGFRARTGLTLHNFYGSSETGGIAYDRAGRDTLAGSVGRAIRGVGVRLMPGKRLRVSGDAVFTHGNRSMVRGKGSWTLPDLATIDARGRITIVGRRGSTVKIAGRRVGLGDVAARLRALPGVDDVWVGFGGRTEAALGAAVATAMSKAQLRELLSRSTPAWKIPKLWHVSPSLPVTARGKLDVKALQRILFGN